MDWYEAFAEVMGEQCKVYVLRCARWRVAERFIAPTITPHSRHSWKRTSSRFDYFGGVFRRLRYDNLKSAVKKILRGLSAGRDRTADRLPLALGL